MSSFSLCQYRDILGKSGEGIHSYRLFGVAIADVVMTIIAAWLLWRFVFPKTHFLIILALFFLAGIILHKLFCVRTTIDSLLFGGGGGGVGVSDTPSDPVPFDGVFSPL